MVCFTVYAPRYRLPDVCAVMVHVRLRALKVYILLQACLHGPLPAAQHLLLHHAQFGRVSEGMEVVCAVGALGSSSGKTRGKIEIVVRH